MRNVRVVAQEFLPRNLLNSTVRAIAMPAGADKRVIWPNDHYVAARIRIVDLLRDDITSGPLLIGSKHPPSRNRKIRVRPLRGEWRAENQIVRIWQTRIRFGLPKDELNE